MNLQSLWGIPVVLFALNFFFLRFGFNVAVIALAIQIFDHKCLKGLKDNISIYLIVI